MVYLYLISTVQYYPKRLQLGHPVAGQCARSPHLRSPTSSTQNLAQIAISDESMEAPPSTSRVNQLEERIPPVFQRWKSTS